MNDRGGERRRLRVSVIMGPFSSEPFGLKAVLLGSGDLGVRSSTIRPSLSGSRPRWWWIS